MKIKLHPFRYDLIQYSFHYTPPRSDPMRFFFLHAYPWSYYQAKDVTCLTFDAENSERIFLVQQLGEAVYQRHHFSMKFIFVPLI